MQNVDELVAVLTRGDETAAEAAATELAALGAAALPALLALLGSADAEHRWWAVRALAGTAKPRTDWFIGALEDSEAEVRAAAALALATHPDERAVGPLVRALSDEDGVVAVLAVNALVKLNGAAVPHLIAAFGEASLRGQINIMRALAGLKDHRSIRLMLDSMERESAALQYWAQEGLEGLGLDMVYIRPD